MSTVSSEFGAFSIIPKALLFSGASSNAVRLYAILYHYSTMANGAMPSRGTLARQMGVKSKTTVDRAIRELVHGGFLTITHRWIHPDKVVRESYAPESEPTTSHYHLKGGIPTSGDRVSQSTGIPTPTEWSQYENEGSKNETSDLMTSLTKREEEATLSWFSSGLRPQDI